MDIDDDEEDMGIDQSYANGDKIMKNQLNSLYGQLEGMMAYHWMNYLNISAPHILFVVINIHLNYHPLLDTTVEFVHRVLF
jgi:hypothetical protein